MNPNANLSEPKKEQENAALQRRPYATPKLRKLGSVRDLTLGSNGLKVDGGVTFRMM